MKKLMFSFLSCILFLGLLSAQELKIPLIGSKAPSFEANSTNGVLTFPDDFGKSWKILFSHPQDFTPVCTSEILELAYLNSEFKKLNVEIAVISTDNVSLHNTWKMLMEDMNFRERGPQKIDFPLFEDTNGKASIKYGMLHEIPGDVRDIRGVYIIDSENRVRSINFYPVEIGRNMNEVIRTVEALQTYDELGVLTPVNWNRGDDVIVRYRPFTVEEYAQNPEKIKKEFYSLNDMVWFKKGTR
jgi:peroxiredoxin (alkyl hydroperoxide reductase subunit C)